MINLDALKFLKDRNEKLGDWYESDGYYVKLPKGIFEYDKSYHVLKFNENSVVSNYYRLKEEGRDRIVKLIIEGKYFGIRTMNSKLSLDNWNKLKEVNK